MVCEPIVVFITVFGNGLNLSILVSGLKFPAEVQRAHFLAIEPIVQNMCVLATPLLKMSADYFHIRF